MLREERKVNSMVTNRKARQVGAYCNTPLQFRVSLRLSILYSVKGECGDG